MLPFTIARSKYSSNCSTLQVIKGKVLMLATIPQYEQDALLLQKMYAKSGITLEILLIPAEKFKGELRMTADLLLFASC